MLTIFVHVSHVVQKKRDIFVNSLEKENNTFHSPLKFPRWYHAVVRAWPLHDGDRWTLVGQGSEEFYCYIVLRKEEFYGKP
jgi:hypothetical protein